jgi:hypothetical protein
MQLPDSRGHREVHLACLTAKISRPKHGLEASHYPVPTVVVHVQRGSFSQKCSGRTAQVAALLAQRLDVVLCALIAGEVADATVGVNPREQLL